MTLTSCWLTTAASALICASALSRASAFSIPTNQHELAEQIKTDITGNMIWKSDNEDVEVPSLTRPDFKSYSSSKSHSQDLDSLFHSHQDGELKKHLNSVLDQVKHEIHEVEHKLDGIIQDGKKKTMNWISEGLVEVDGMQFERHIHPSFPNYSLRLSTSKNQSLCDPNVKQHSGYLDIGDSKHLWFVFFESRSSPKDDPVLLWLNGGPGCSSSTGLLFELGPCTIKKDGSGTTNNPYSWTNKANMIFLDQPVSVGYSYSDDGGSPINNTPQAAEDVYAFLQLFFKKFPEYSTQEFSLAAESYGGRYGPVIASTLANKNKALARSRYVGENAPKNINLSSLMLGNGLTSAKTQFGSVKEYACDGDYAIFDPESSTCKSLEQKSGVCQNLIEQCYKYDSRLTCTPAAIYCWSSLYGPAQQSGLNLYDVRKKCNRDEDKDGPLCYPAMQAIEKYMNLPDVKESFGVPDSVEFQSCNMQVNQNFMMQGDSMHDTSLLLPELIEDGMRLLVYAGEADFMCNAIGNERWVTELETSYKEEFAKSNGTWFVKQAEKQHTSSKDPKQLGGWFKKAGKGAGNVAFVKAKDSGHMFPMDQPEAASDMVSRWLANESFE